MSPIPSSEGRWEPVADFRTALIKIVTIVSFFTLAHSVTLSLAALDYVRLSSRLVESIKGQPRSLREEIEREGQDSIAASILADLDEGNFRDA